MGHPLYRIIIEKDQDIKKLNLECDVCGEKYVDVKRWLPL